MKVVVMGLGGRIPSRWGYSSLVEASKRSENFALFRLADDE
jgi:hypothetical protein